MWAGPLCSVATTALLGGRFYSAVVAVEALKVGFGKALLPLSTCPVPKEVTAKAREAHMATSELTCNLCERLQSCSEQLKVSILSLLCSPWI